MISKEIQVLQLSTELTNIRRLSIFYIDVWVQSRLCITKKMQNCRMAFAFLPNLDKCLNNILKMQIKKYRKFTAISNKRVLEKYKDIT